MKELLATVLALWVLASAAAQRSPGFEWDNTPSAQADTSRATNVTIGEWTVTACYPDKAEFALRFKDMQLSVTLYDSTGTPSEVLYDALLSQSDSEVFRAEICPQQWVEVNARTGITLAHYNCSTRVFLPNGKTPVMATRYGKEKD